METEKLPKFSVVEPWWRAWLWAGLPGFCATLGFAAGAVAAYLIMFFYSQSQGEEMGQESRGPIFFIIVAAASGTGYGQILGAAIVKKLRGHSGEEPPVFSSQVADSQQDQHFVAGADESVNKSGPIQET